MLTTIEYLEKKMKKMMLAAIELGNEINKRDSKLTRIKEIIESNDSDLVGSLYRIKIILDN